MADFITRFLGSGGKKNETPSAQQAIQKLRETEELLNKKVEFIESKIDIELANAKKHGLKNKGAALKSLKRKKRLEKQLSQLDGSLSTIEFQRETLENAGTTMEVFNSMSYAAKTLKSLHDQVNLDDLQDTMDDIKDHGEFIEEIQRITTTPFADEFDEDELFAEFQEQMEQEELDKELLTVGEPTNEHKANEDSFYQFPSIPTSTPKQLKTVEEDDGLRELEAWGAS